MASIPKKTRRPGYYTRKDTIAMNRYVERVEKYERNKDYPLVLKVERKLLEETLQLPDRGGIPKDKVTELQAAFKRRRTPWTPSQINRDEKLRLDARNYIFKCRAESGNTVEDEGKYDGDRIRRYKKWGRGVQEAIHGPNWAGAEKERPPRLDDEKPVANAEATGKKSPPAEADKENSLRDRDVQIETQVLSPHPSDDEGDDEGDATRDAGLKRGNEQIETQVISPHPSDDDDDGDIL